MPTATQTKHVRVHVSGWSYNRHVEIREDAVSMEIARTHCQHCPTCSGRIASCKRALGSREFSRQSAGGGEYFIIPLPSELARSEEEVIAWLGGVLNLSLTLVAG